MKKLRKALYCVATIAVAGMVTVFSIRQCERADMVVESRDTARLDTMPLMIMQLRQCSRLNVVEMRVHKIITHDDATRIGGTLMGKDVSISLPTGKRKVAIPLYATVRASIDMSQLTADNVRRQGDKIEIFLPRPQVQITETHVDHEGIKQYVSLLRQNFSDEELQTYQKRGRQQIEQELPQLNLEERARVSAARQLVPIVRSLGFDESNITITFVTDETHSNTIIRKDR